MPRTSAFLNPIFVAFMLAGMALAQPLPVEKKSSPFKPDDEVEDHFMVAFSLPVKFLYLEQASVRDELKLTKQQIEQIENAKKAWSEAARKRANASEAEATSKLLRTIPLQIDGSLTAAQSTRLRQIMLRHCEKEKGMSAALAIACNDLELTPKQRERFEDLRRKRAETVLEHLTSGERFTAIRRQVYETNNDHADEVAKLLTPEQQAKLKTLFGDPFKGEIRLKPSVIGISTKPISPIYREKLFGFYALEAKFLIDEAVQLELKMSDDQIRKAKEFHVEWSKQFEETKNTQPDVAKVFQSLHSLVKKEIKGILEKQSQRDRFISIMVQHREKVGGIAAACGYPEVADAMRLTEEQVKSLKEGMPAEAAVYGIQMRTYTKIVGERFTGQVQIEDPFAAKNVPAPVVKQVFVPAIDERKLNLAGHMIDNAKRLRLTDQQIARLKEIAEDAPKLKELLRRELSSLPASTDVATKRNGLPESHAVVQCRKAIVEQCLEVLDEKQRSLHGAALKEAAGDINIYKIVR